MHPQMILIQYVSDYTLQ